MVSIFSFMGIGLEGSLWDVRDYPCSVDAKTAQI